MSSLFHRLSRGAQGRQAVLQPTTPVSAYLAPDLGGSLEAEDLVEAEASAGARPRPSARTGSRRESLLEEKPRVVSGEEADGAREAPAAEAPAPDRPDTSARTKDGLAARPPSAEEPLDRTRPLSPAAPQAGRPVPPFLVSGRAVESSESNEPRPPSLEHARPEAPAGRQSLHLPQQDRPVPQGPKPSGEEPGRRREVRLVPEPQPRAGDPRILLTERPAPRLRERVPGPATAAETRPHEVVISIGRIEITAETPAAAAAPAKRRHAPVSLEHYLAERDRGRR